MNQNLRLDARAAETGAQEVHLRLHRGQVILRSPLQDKARSQRGQVGGLGHMKKDIARKHRCQAGQNLLGAPALTLKVDDIRLQEDSAAVAEVRHRLGGKGGFRIALDGNAKALRGGLQEIAIAGRALRIEPEIADAAIAQQDELDVLPADIDDDLRVGKAAQGRFGVGHGFHQGRVGAEHLFENILGVAGCCRAQDMQACAGIFHLAAEIAQHLDGVGNGVALGEAIGLGQHLAARR